jgi:diacylglycerol kinase (ATP)
VRIEEMLRAGGAHIDCEASGSPQDLVRIAAQSSTSGYDRVVICGGDGSLNLALREFDLVNGTIALIPSGSGDDFARVLGIPRSLEAACELVFHGRVREVDLALANGFRYAGVAGFGFDSEVAEYANRNVRFLRGSLVYLYAIFRVLPRFRPLEVRVSRDGKMNYEAIMFAAVGNSRQYGGGIRITPDARIDDGELDLCIVHQTSRLQLLRTLPLAYTGGHVKNAFVETRRGREFHFASEKPLAVYADGEPLTTTPVTFALAEQKLRIVGP